MALSNEQIQELLQKPKNTALIQKAIDHENNLRYHSEVYISNNYLNRSSYHDDTALGEFSECTNPYHLKFLQFVRRILTANDKFEQFKHLLRFPLLTNDIVDSISDEYGKVFDAQDSFINVDFTDPELSDDFSQYLEKVKDNEFWHEKAFSAMMKAISSIIIVDLPAMQTTDRPEPYYYLLDIRKVKDVSVNVNGDIDYIIFSDKDNRIAFFDDAAYHIYEKTDQDTFIETGFAPHPLGYCPAHFFWSDSMSKENPVLKLAPISSILTKLDWLLFFETSKKSLDLYASYPIYWAYQSKCDYRDPHGNECVDGHVIYYDEEAGKEVVKPCPVCEAKKLVGPGSLLEKPLPRGDTKIDGAPAGIISIDRDSLDYNVEESERLEAQIMAGATGKMKLLNKTAINQDQVQSQFESQTNILNWIARNFEKSHKWTYDTVCQLRYGDSYSGCSISYGTQFYLLSLSDAITDFKATKDSGAPFYILMSKLNMIEHLQSKNNPKELTRFSILKAIEPYPLLTLKECKDNGIDTFDKDGFVLKCNFANFVSKFETEYGSIIEFGSKLPMPERVNRILTKFKEYGREISNNQSGGGADSNNPNNGQPIPTPQGAGSGGNPTEQFNAD